MMKQKKPTKKSQQKTSTAALSALFESLEVRTLMSTYYMAPGGSDSAAGSSAAPFASFSKAYTAMKGGDTLIVKNGTYNQQQVLTRSVRPPSGSAGAYTVVKAETPDGVVVDGKGTMSPISMDGVPNSPISYVQIDGIVFRHQGYGASLYQIDHVKFTRDGFEDASDGNSMTLNVGKYCSYILVEDSFAWGSGRYKFSTYHADHVIFRRLVARFDRAVATPDPMAVFVAYASDRVEIQNCISVDGDHPEYWINAQEYAGSFSIPSTDGPSTNINITGSLALNVDMQFGTLTKNLSNINISNSVGWHIREGVLARDSANYNHMTFGDIYGPSRQTQTVGLNWVEGDDPNNTTSLNNSILFNIKGTALSNWNSEDYNDFYSNTSNRNQYTGTGSHSITANPGLKFPISTQGASSAIIGKASDGGDLGANLIKRIGVTGTLWGETGYNTVTGEDLWPWPNEDIIGTFMRSYSYQNLSGNRGFAATGQTLTDYVWNYLGNGNPYAGSTGGGTGGGGGTTTPDPTAPAAPSALNATTASATQINVSWNDNSDNETGFILERQVSGGAWQQIASLTAGVTSYNNTGLSSATTYSYRVKATNSMGASAYSAVDSATTLTVVLAPSAPDGLAASSVNASSIALEWTDNSNNETGFLIERKTGSGNFSQIASLAAGVTSYNDSGLSAGTQYTYRVRATNSGGNSAYSNTSSATTALNLPAAPSALNAAASSATSVVLTWSDNAGNESGFLIERKTGTGSYAQIASVGQGIETYTDATTVANTLYTYRVRATNSAGNSAYSNTDSVTTPQVIPTAPSGLGAVATGPNAVDLDWTDGSTNETGFLIERKTGGGSYVLIATVAKGTSSYTDSNLTPDTDYSYRVRATNAAGNSAYSSAVAVTTPQITLNAPTTLTAVLSGPSTTFLSWTDASDNEVNFLIERKTGSGSFVQIATVTGNNTSYTDNNLASDKQYTYRVRATNGTVNSGYSNTDSVITAETLPGAPSALEAIAQDADRVDLTWTDNSGNESGFIVERKTGSGDFVQVASLAAGVESFGDTNVQPTTSYQYRVYATNAAGDSAYSNTTSVTTPDVAPTSPTNLMAVSDSEQVSLTWVDNSDNESAFVIERSNGSTYTAIATVAPGTTTYTDNSVSENQQYTYRVKAKNSAGSSHYTNVVSADTTTSQPAASLDLAGNDMGSARLLGTMQPGQVKVAEEAVGISDRNDLYKIDLVTTTAIQTRLLDMNGDADLQILDVHGNRVAYSKHTGDSDESITNTLAAGTYFVRVLCISGEDTSYRLRIATSLPSVGASNPGASSVDLGGIRAGLIKIVEGQVGTTNRNDLFKFSLNQATKVYAKLSGLGDDADLMILNSDGERVAYSKKTGTTNDRLTLQLSAGTYYVRVLFTKGTLSTKYRLRLAGLN